MTIAIYGATGFVGSEVARELLRRGHEVRLTGRDPHRLQARALDLGGGVTWRAATLDDGARLAEALDGCSVLVNCAAPLSLCGEPLLRAALASRVHYIDPAGEQAFIRRVFEVFGDDAKERGVALVPAMGFDYALGDCLSRLAASRHQPASQVLVAYAVFGSGVGRGSARFAVETPGGGEVVYRDGAWHPVPLELDRASFAFPPPVGRQPMGRYAAGEVITVPRHTTTASVKSLITARSLVPHPVLLPVFPVVRPLVGLVRQTPLRRLLAWLVGSLGSSRGPQARDVETSRFMIAVEARGEDGSVGRGLVEGHDFYGLTNHSLAYGAERLSRPRGDLRGALPPALAVDPRRFLDYLGAFGVEWSLDGH